MSGHWSTLYIYLSVSIVPCALCSCVYICIRRRAYKTTCVLSFWTIVQNFSELPHQGGEETRRFLYSWQNLKRRFMSARTPIRLYVTIGRPIEMEPIANNSRAARSSWEWENKGTRDGDISATWICIAYVHTQHKLVYETRPCNHFWNPRVCMCCL